MVRALDILFFVVFTGLGIALFAMDSVLSGYINLTSNFPYIMGFLKFAVLATFGESLAQRIATGTYLPPNFGLGAKSLVWGIFGIGITGAFYIFSVGAPFVLDSLGFKWGPLALASEFGIHKIVAAFTVSVTLNLIFAPILMVSHSLTDMHISKYAGSMTCFTHKPDIGAYLQALNWHHVWKNVLVRNILFFWIPMHTITFLLPPVFRLLFAALLGACLGLILTMIKIKEQKASM